MSPSSAVPLTFDEVSVTNRARCERWHPGFPDDEQWSIADWGNALAGEVGELCNVLKKIRRHECGLANAGDPPREQLLVMAEKEHADVELYLDLLATKLGINRSRSIAAKFNEVSHRQGFPETLRMVPASEPAAAPKRPKVRIEGGARVCIYCNRVLTFNFMRDDGGDCDCAGARAEVAA